MPAVRVLSGRLHRGSADAAGFDLFTTERACLWPGERVSVLTGIRTSIDPGVVGLIRDRSGLAANRGVTTLAGVIDSDYRGEWKVVLLNTGGEAVTLEIGDRCAQVVFVPVVHDVSVEGDAFITVDAREREVDGFGSTGR